MSGCLRQERDEITRERPVERYISHERHIEVYHVINVDCKQESEKNGDVRMHGWNNKTIDNEYLRMRL